MTRQPRAFFALDFGSATTSAALIGHAGGRWRLLGHAAAPAATDLDALLYGIVDRVGRAEPEILAFVSDTEHPQPAALTGDLVRLEARSGKPRRLAILAGSRRQRRKLEEAALRAGWLVAGASADVDDAVVLSRLALAASTDAVLLGADSNPGGDERRHLPMLGALLAAAARRRPELAVILAGGAAVAEASFLGAGEHDRITEVSTSPGAPAAGPDEGESGTAKDDSSASAPSGSEPATEPAHLTYTAALAVEEGHDSVLLAPDADAGSPAGAALQQVLEGLRVQQDDGRLAILRSVRSMANLLEKTIEVIEVGMVAGLRCRAEPRSAIRRASLDAHVTLASGSFAPVDLTDEIVDQVLSWSTVNVERYRLVDRLRDLRFAPWGETDGEGALLRLAAAKSAVGRLVAATPEISAKEMPQILVAAGGIWAATPPSVVALALADLVRRPGVSRLAYDQARLLAPLGTITDDEERARMLTDLQTDVLVPLGSLVLPAGIKSGRSAGRMRVTGGPSNSDIDLQPGGIWAVELPPGQVARADMEFRDVVTLDAKGRRFDFEVTGGLGGLFVDMRDIPLRLPDRADQKRATWEAWQRAMWPEIDE